MATRKCAGYTPGVAVHGCIKPIGLEIKIIQRHHLNRETQSPCGGFNPLPECGLPTSRQSTESEQTTFSLALLRQAQNGQTNRPQPIRRRFRVPLIEGHLVALASPLFCTPGDGISQLKVLEQPLLVVARNQTLALRIQL